MSRHAGNIVTFSLDLGHLPARPPERRATWPPCQPARQSTGPLGHVATPPASTRGQGRQPRPPLTLPSKVLIGFPGLSHRPGRRRYGANRVADQAVPRAMAFLREQLAQGPCDRETLLSHAEAIGLSFRTLERAKSQLGVVSQQRREGGRLFGAGGWAE